LGLTSKIDDALSEDLSETLSEALSERWRKVLKLLAENEESRFSGEKILCREGFHWKNGSKKFL
jgi:hypothetical protein